MGNQKYRPEILEPMPLLSRHGAPTGVIQGISTIKMSVIPQMPMYCGLSMKINTHDMLHSLRKL